MAILKWVKNPKLVKTLLDTLPYSARPMKVNGTWRSPKLSGRQVAELRKAAAFHGFEWPMKDSGKNCFTTSQSILASSEAASPEGLQRPFSDSKELLYGNTRQQQQGTAASADSDQATHISFKKHGFMKPLRGKKALRGTAKLQRINEINERLKTMSQKVEELREQERLRRWKDPYDLGDFGKGIGRHHGKELSGKSGQKGKKKK